jgi:hypothetical protein
MHRVASYVDVVVAPCAFTKFFVYWEVSFRWAKMWLFQQQMPNPNFGAFARLTIVSGISQ